jgi:hypothetical protein
MLTVFMLAPEKVKLATVFRVSRTTLLSII